MTPPFRTSKSPGRRPIAASEWHGADGPVPIPAAGGGSWQSVHAAARYAYYGRSGAFDLSDASKVRARRLGERRLHPTLRDADFLVLRQRRRHFVDLLARLSASLRVLDVGGRIQPYRPLLETRAAQYVGLDPQASGLIDLVAVGEQMPFADDTFDLVLCTQMLGYASQPGLVIDEIHRVLKPGGYLFLSAPAFFPVHHDERWRFLPDGYGVLLGRFERITVHPEGLSPAGIYRTAAVFCDELFEHRALHALMRATAIPLLNLSGLLLDAMARKDHRFTANYSVEARK